MSRPRSRSPHYRVFPLGESSFDPYKVLAELDKDQQDRTPGLRGDPEEHLGYFRGRSPHFSDDRTLWKQHNPNQMEFFHRRPSPHHDGIVHDDRRISSSRDRGGYGDRRRGGFHSQSFENRGRSPHSLQRVMRERLPSMPLSHSDHKQRESERGIGWMGDQQDRGQGRFRDLSPGGRSDDQRGRRNTQGPNRDRQREDSHTERNPPFKRHRRQMDDGFRTEEGFMDQRYPVDLPRDSFGGEVQKSRPHGDKRHSGPLVVEHDHGISCDRKRYDDRRHPDFDRQWNPPVMSSAQERFTTSHNRFDDREGARRPHPQDNWREAKFSENRSSPTPQDGTNSMGYGSQHGPMNHRDRGSPLSARGSFGQAPGGRTGPNRNQHRSQQSPQGYQGPPHEERRLEYRPFRNDNANKEESGWTQETRPQCKHDRSGSLNRPLFKTDMDPKMPRARQQGWTDQKSTTVETEETLTIKVDMSQPVNQNSSLCNSSDRQLSLDLVNVGRQRLDFLPMLEHSGTYQETSTHTGTFAQEIISLVHHVKEQYFRDAGVTLNERFSAPPTGGHAEAETEELTLDQRFSSNQGFNLEMVCLLDKDEPLFSRLSPLQPVRGPGDLRHDLDRRRQERQEGVKVTISGNSTLQRPQASFSDLAPEHSQDDEVGLMEDEGSNWTQEGNMGPRGGMSYRQPGFQRRNNRFNNRFRPMRR